MDAKPNVRVKRRSSSEHVGDPFIVDTMRGLRRAWPPTQLKALNRRGGLTRFVVIVMAVLLAAGGAFIAPTGVAATAPTWSSVRVSLTTQGDQIGVGGPGGAADPNISGDGQHVTFSATDPIVNAPGSGDTQIFVRDLATNTTEQVSVDNSGQGGGRRSSGGALSADGQVAAFGSYATLSEADENGFVSDVYVRDRVTHTTELVSVSTAGVQGDGPSESGGGLGDVSISADGKWVAFASQASNLVPGDTNGVADVFLRHRDGAASTTERVSVATDGTESDAASFFVTISADGTTVSFTSSATNLVAGDTNGVSDAFVHDRVTGVTERVSVGSSGSQANALTQYPASLSADGSAVAFISNATNLVSGDTNAAPDVFVRDRAAGTTERVSVTSSGVQGADPAPTGAVLSDDGTIVVFSTRASLVPDPADPSGRIGDDFDVYVRNRLTATTDLVSRTPSGVAGNSYSGLYSNGLGVDVDGTGTSIAFHSVASDLVAGDTNDDIDVFVARLAAVDAVAPNTTISAGPPTPTTSASATFTFVGSDDTTPANALTFACRIDTAPFAACTSPTSVTVADGDHTFEVQAIDGAGNADATPASYAWTYSDPFVRRAGTQLLLHEQPYHFSGVNIYNANSDGWCGYQYTDAELGAAFDAIGPNGVVRAWFFQSLAASKSAGSPHHWSGARDWSRFDRTLALAAQKGIRVIATLTDQWGECGDGPVAGYKSDAFYRDGYTVAEPLELALDPAHGYDHWVAYRAWVPEVVTRYKDRPEILAWQLINEGEAKTSKTGSCPADATEVMAAWASDVSTMIHGLDSNHLISLGTIGTGQCGAGSTAKYKTLHASPNIDLCEVHDDVDPTKLMPGDAFNGLPAALARCTELGKPVFVGEIGVKPVDAGGTLASRRDQVRAKIEAEDAAGVVGHLAWIYNHRFPTRLLDGSLIGARDPMTYYDIGPGDPVLATLAGVPVVRPPAPGNVTAAAGDGAASIAWLPPSSDGGASITQYVLSSSPSGASSTVAAPSTSATLSGLTNGTAYTFTVKAKNAIGTGPGMESASVTPTAGAPAPQTTIVAIPPTGGTVATDPTGTLPTTSNPLITTVTVPAGSGGGLVTVAETSIDSAPPSGYAFLDGQQVLITSTASTSVTNPLKIAFTFDPALPAVIFRNGTPIDTACSPVNTATPSPCIASTGPGSITILTVQASAWNIGMRLYAFTGFFSPVDNQPVVNLSKPGAAIPVKFGLGGDRGLGIFAKGYPKSTSVACATQDPIDAVEETAAPGAATLSFDAVSGVYQYTWKTDKAWVGTCRQLILTFLDGTTHLATFKFK